MKRLLAFSALKKKKINGFILLESVVSVFLLSLILLTIINILISTQLLKKRSFDSSNRELEIEFGVEYIFNELDSGHMFIPTENNYNNQWLGLVIVSDLGLFENKISDRFSYTTYILENRSIRRANYKYGRLVNKIDFKSFYSPNIVIKNIKEFHGEIDLDKKILTLHITDLNDIQYTYSKLLKGVFYE